MSKSRINVAKIITDFGGVASLTRQLEAIGNPITKGGVEKWRERSSIPSRYLLALALLAEQEGRDFKLIDYKN